MGTKPRFRPSLRQYRILESANKELKYQNARINRAGFFFFVVSCVETVAIIGFIIKYALQSL